MVAVTKIYPYLLSRHSWGDENTSKEPSFLFMAREEHPGKSCTETHKTGTYDGW